MENGDPISVKDCEMVLRSYGGEVCRACLYCVVMTGFEVHEEPVRVDGDVRVMVTTERESEVLVRSRCLLMELGRDGCWVCW